MFLMFIVVLCCLHGLLVDVLVKNKKIIFLFWNLNLNYYLDRRYVRKEKKWQEVCLNEGLLNDLICVQKMNHLVCCCCLKG